MTFFDDCNSLSDCYTSFACIVDTILSMQSYTNDEKLAEITSYRDGMNKKINKILEDMQNAYEATNK